MRKISLGLVLLAAALLAGASGADEKAASQPTPKANPCFFARDWQSWKPAADAKSFIIRVNYNHYYRVELSSSCPELKWPDARLITRFHGTDTVCNALDWDLRVSQGPPVGFPVACIVKRQVPLTPAEVLALPKKERP